MWKQRSPEASASWLLKANQQYEHHLEHLIDLHQRINRSKHESELDSGETVPQLPTTLRALAATRNSRRRDKGHSSESFLSALGKQIGLNDRQLITLENGALLHDIGK
jgi:response regulator RpfG family c-di-GMP phosphodiesterase